MAVDLFKTLQSEVEQMYGMVGKKLPDTEDLRGLKHALSERSVLLARSAEVWASVKRVEDVAAGRVAQECMKGNVQASYMREIMKAEMAEVTELVRRSERLNATITHQIEILRSLVSLAKAEMNLG